MADEGQKHSTRLRTGTLKQQNFVALAGEGGDAHSHSDNDSEDNNGHNSSHHSHHALNTSTGSSSHRHNGKASAHQTPQSDAKRRPAKRAKRQSKQEEDAEDHNDDDNDEEEEDTRLYCVCQSRDDGSFMAACDGCDNWFHPKCVGKTQKEMKAMKNYLCDKCHEIASGLINISSAGNGRPPATSAAAGASTAATASAPAQTAAAPASASDAATAASSSLHTSAAATPASLPTVALPGAPGSVLASLPLDARTLLQLAPPPRIKPMQARSKRKLCAYERCRNPVMEGHEFCSTECEGKSAELAASQMFGTPLGFKGKHAGLPAAVLPQQQLIQQLQQQQQHFQNLQMLQHMQQQQVATPIQQQQQQQQPVDPTQQQAAAPAAGAAAGVTQTPPPQNASLDTPPLPTVPAVPTPASAAAALAQTQTQAQPQAAQKRASTGDKGDTQV